MFAITNFLVGVYFADQRLIFEDVRFDLSYHS